MATSRLFNWHRGHDGGLWLDDGAGQSIETIRELQRHPWVMDPFDDGNCEPVEDKTKAQELDSDGIVRWIAEVEGSPDIGKGGQA